MFRYMVICMIKKTLLNFLVVKIPFLVGFLNFRKKAARNIPLSRKIDEKQSTVNSTLYHVVFNISCNSLKPYMKPYMRNWNCMKPDV